MKKWVKECLWAGLLIILPIILVSRNQHGNNNTVDINIYDVYFVIDKYIGLLAIFTALSFPVYLIRAITARFKDTVINYLLMILTIALIVLLWYLNKTVEYMSGGGWTIYPPLSSPPTEIPPSEPVIDIVYIIILQIILLLLFAFTMYKTLRKQKHL